jgi:phospholipase/carboxylesterase
VIAPRAAFALATAALLGCDAAPPAPSTPAPTARAAEPKPAAAPGGLRPGEAAGVRYLERTTGGASAEDALPLVVAIHGLGDRPEDFAGLFDGLRARVRLVLPYGEAWQSGYAWWTPAGAGMDLDRVAAGCDRAAARLAPMLAELSAKRPTVGKPIVTGFSQGGMLSFTLAVRHPEVVAEALPVSGLLAPALWPASWPAGRVAPPVHALHGDADARVAVGLAEKSVAKLRELGFEADLARHAGVGHAVSPAMRADLHARIGAAAERAR